MTDQVGACCEDLCTFFAVNCWHITPPGWEEIDEAFGWFDFDRRKSLPPKTSPKTGRAGRMDEENPFSHDDEWIQCQLAGTARHILPFDIDIWHNLNLTLPSFLSLSHCLGTDKESGKLFIRYWGAVVLFTSRFNSLSERKGQISTADCVGLLRRLHTTRRFTEQTCHSRSQ